MNRLVFKLLFCLLIAYPVTSFSQALIKADQAKKMEIFQMMKDKDINFYDIQKKADEYYLYRDKGKGSGYKQYQRWAWFVGQRTFPHGERPDPTIAFTEASKFKKSHPASKAFSNQWTELGPKTSANVTTHWAPGIGRINDIAIHPNNSDIIYVATPAGGIWKTTNEGQTWAPLTDDLPVMGISGIAIDPYNTNTVYIGTGDRDANDTYSIGVLKSTDGGTTWNTTGLNWTIYDKAVVCCVKIKPGTSNEIFAGTSDGLYKSTDAGDNWTKVLDGEVEDIEFQPNNANTIYAVSNTTSTYFHKSTDGGDTFTSITSGLPSSSRVFISVTPANVGYVYLLSANTSGGFGGLYRSSNYGGSFSLRGSSPDIFGYEADDGWSQSYYDMCLAASPVNSEEVHIGAITTWKTTNGGQTFTQTSKWYYTAWLNEMDQYRYIHCDMHALEYTPDGTLYSGSDGMICKTTDGFATHENTFNLTEGLGIRQFYGIGLSATNPDKYIGGSQDNGTSVTLNGEWVEWLGADGGDCFIDWSDENIIYGTYQNGGAWYKSTDGGLTNQTVNSPGSGAWVVPWAMDFNDANTLYVGCQEVRKTTDQMANWVSISDFSNGANIDVVKVAPSNSEYLYVTKRVNNALIVYRTKDGGVTWEEITDGLPNLAATKIAIHPSDEEKIAISFSGYTEGQKVYTSTDAGDTWTNVSGNLPNIPANCVLYHDIDEDGLYVGMDVGVYYIDNTLTDWEPFMTGLPNVIVNELEIQYKTNKLRAGTYGRGLWEAEVAVPKTLIVDFTSDSKKVFPGKTITFTDKSEELNGTITNWEWTFEGGQPATFTGQNPPAILYPNEGLFDVELTVTSTTGTDSKRKIKYIKIAEEYSMGETEVVTCSGKFYSSGLYYNYDNDEQIITTIKPDGAGKMVVVDFTQFQVEYGMDCENDYLEIYDGTDTSAPLIGKFCARQNPGTIIANNPDGALTFKFVSDTYYNTKGWEADIRCIDSQ